MVSGRDERFAWAETGPAAVVMEALNAVGEARLVGGCVRDSLLGLPPGAPGRTDIDIATTLPPREASAALGKAQIRVVPTGVEHGTITAVVDHVPVEVTTLRADLSTDGRRATVAFSSDWTADARRRDFTINALYRDQAGEIFDPTGGLIDLEARLVRFIDDPSHRIQEDYLRILRFLRFSARFSDGLDPAGWAACQRHRDGIDILSKERIWHEMSRLFGTSRAPMALRHADNDHVLRVIFDGGADVAGFERLHHARGGDISPALGATALWPTATRAMLKAAFRPSNAELDHVDAIARVVALGREGKGAHEWLYRAGGTATDDAVALANARGEPWADHAAASHRDLAVPILPVQGADIMAHGIPAGPSVGKIMRAFEQAWLDAGCPSTECEVTALLNDTIAKTSV